MGARGRLPAAGPAPSLALRWEAALLDEELPALIGSLGRPDFPAALDAALRALAPFDLSCVFAYAAGARPRLLHDGLGGVAAPGVMEAYLDGGYLLDCVYTACKRGAGPGLWRLRDIAPDAFFEGPYFNSPEIHPCISLESGALAEEIVFLAPFGRGVTLAYSLMRAHGRPAFEADGFARLAAAEPLVRALIARHWAEEAERPVPAEPAPAADGFAAEVLSAREREVVRLVLEGHSSLSIALRLGIAEGTVKNHRKNVHAKLGISSEAELFALFLRHLRRA